MIQNDSIQLFKEKASLVSAFIYEAGTMDEAFQTALMLCQEKAPCQNLLASTSADILHQNTQNESQGDINGVKKIFAAPNLPENHFDALSSLCIKYPDIKLIRDGLRQYPGGIDIGLTLIDYGIADTGTLVLKSDSEETRLSTMLSEFHVALLPVSRLKKTALSMTDELKTLTSNPNSYTAFITGASRTADIERVLAIGVHGPLELHIILLED